METEGVRANNNIISKWHGIRTALYTCLTKPAARRKLEQHGLGGGRCHVPPKSKRNNNVWKAFYRCILADEIQH
jgi:hypothetical protein